MVRAREGHSERLRTRLNLYFTLTMNEGEYEVELNRRYRSAKSSLMAAWSELLRGCGGGRVPRRRPLSVKRAQDRARCPFEDHNRSRAEMYASLEVVRDQIDRICCSLAGAVAHCASRGADPVTYRVRFSAADAEPRARVLIVARQRGDVLYQCVDVTQRD